MTEQAQPLSYRALFANIYKLFGSLSFRRKVQISGLFVLQIISALLEVVSIGAVVPFLSALSDIETLMANDHIIRIMDVTKISETHDLIALLAILFSGTIVVSNIVRFLTLLTQQYLSAMIATDLGTRLFENTLYKPYKYYLDNNTSELIGNTTNDLNGTLGVLYGVFTLMTQGLVTVSIALGLLAYDPEVAIMLSVIVVIAYTVITYATNKRLQRNSGILSDSYRKIIQSLQEGFGGIRYILMNRTQPVFAKQYRAADSPFRLKSAENSIIRQAPRFFMESIGVLVISALAISFTAKSQNISEIIPLMGFLVFGSYRLLPAMQQVYSSIGSVLGLSASLDRVVSILSQSICDTVAKPVTKPLIAHNMLQFEQLSFSYTPDESWSLQDLNFTIKAKTTVALVGHTGSGKTTVSDLILGLMAPQKGTISIDGTVLTPENMGAWQAGLSHVPQTIFLTDATIASNIAFGIPVEEIDMERVKEAAQMAQLDEFIQTLPNQYMEEVGERGVRLSGGQRQRIGIARALYQKPSMIVLDEATSALDNKTEKDVMKAIDALKHELTIVMIAHRLSTIKNADNILLFDQGKLVDQGDYKTLMKNSEAFKNLAGDLT